MAIIKSAHETTEVPQNFPRGQSRAGGAQLFGGVGRPTRDAATLFSGRVQEFKERGRRSTLPKFKSRIGAQLESQGRGGSQ